MSNREDIKLDTFTLAYIECALWSSSGYVMDENDDTSLQQLNFDVDDIETESLRTMADECADFQKANAELLAKAGDDEQNGHDFWLTRNHHGAGYWDRGYDSDVGDALTKAANACGDSSLYINRNGNDDDTDNMDGWTIAVE